MSVCSPLILNFLGYAIIQLPELMMSTFVSLKKVLITRGMIGPNTLHVQSMKLPYTTPTATLKAVAMANKHNKDVNFGELMSTIDRKIDERVNMAIKEILDSMNIR